MRTNPPIDMFTGTQAVGAAPVVLLAYQDLLQRAPRHMLWLTNTGPDAVNVQFTGSPDGHSPDEDSTVIITCAVGHAVGCYGDGLRRYWAISAWSNSATVCTVAWGVTLDVYSGS